MGSQRIGFHFHIDIFQSKNMAICVSMKLQKTDFHPFLHRNKMMFWEVGICKHLLAEKKKTVGKSSLHEAPFLFTNPKSDTHTYSSLSLAYFSNILITQYCA